MPRPSHWVRVQIRIVGEIRSGVLRIDFTKALLRLYTSLNRSMILLQDVVQVLNRPVAAKASQDSFLFTPEIADS